jgi:hypothetical protein
MPDFPPFTQRIKAMSNINATHADGTPANTAVQTPLERELLRIAKVPSASADNATADGPVNNGTGVDLIRQGLRKSQAVDPGSDQRAQ